MCGRVGYITEEGKEACFEVRNGREYVKGARGIELPAGAPRCKLDAVQDADVVFDALRTAVILARSVGECAEALHRVHEETACKEALSFANFLDEQLAWSEGCQNLDPPEGFRTLALTAYMEAVMDASYFFSYDEVAAVAKHKFMSLVIVQDVDEDHFEPCCVVDGGGPECLIMLIKDAVGQQRVRSHFERLVPQRAVVDAGQYGLLEQAQSLCAALPEHGLLEQLQSTPTLHPGEDCFCEGESGNPGAAAPEKDGGIQLEKAVAALLHAYGSDQPVSAVLNGLPMFSNEITSPDWSHFKMRLNAAVREYVCCDITAAEAVNLSTPLWRTCFFPILVLFEAWGRTTGLPTVFYVDSFYTLLASLLKKDITYNAANVPCRARYWAVGTAAPGSGQSPALEPLKKALMEVLNEVPELAPGKNADGFHIQPVGTHMAAIDRLRHTGGYQFIGAAEGGPILCPSWPSSSTWNQGTHINWQRYLDAATRAFL